MSREDLPHIRFYIGDWRRDVGVQSLSYHYRGIWLELLMLMHCSEQRGRLVLLGKPMSDDSISRLLGLSRQEGAKAIQVLLESAVASRDSDGALICRRMIREAQISQARKEAGSKGLAKRWQNPDNGTDNGTGKKSREHGSMGRIGAIFHRGPDTPWTEKELAALRKLKITEDDLVAVERYYARHWPPHREHNILRHGLLTLLNNWPGEADRARAWCVKHPPPIHRKVRAPVLAPEPERPPEDPKATKAFCEKFERHMGRLPAGYERNGEEIVFVGGITKSSHTPP
jgi:uncharacterized protein YdaU (DUF1376 family)